MALTLGAASFATSAQAVPLASAFPSVAASNADSSFTKVHMSKKQHMMMMKKKQHMRMKKKQHMMMKKKQHMM